jgi:hypothetical protein
LVGDAWRGSPVDRSTGASALPAVDGSAGSTGRGEGVPYWLGAGLVLAAFVIVVPAGVFRPGVTFGLAENVQIAEAQAWWNGRLDIPERKWDTAEIDGRVYSYFPPMFTILSAAVVPFFDGVPHWFVAAVVAAVPLLAYALFQELTGSLTWAVVLSLGLVLGTSALPVLAITLSGARPYHANQALALIGLLLILIDLFGARRIWPACIGLFVASLSRQMTVFFALPVLVTAVWETPRAMRRGRIAAVFTTLGIIGLVYCGLNAAKFGHPLRTGYMLIHEGREDAIARDARAHALFSPHWVPRNLYYANVGPPDLHKVTVVGKPRWYLRPNTMGSGIWWTTPVLLWLFLDWRRCSGGRKRTALVLSAAVIYALLLLWYTTGAVQRGFNRFSLDYLPVLLALVVPACLVGRRRWFTLGMIVWSVLYFRLFIYLPHVRVW